MAGGYKTPGVTIEETSKLPTSIAPVATAIPAFIGYTRIAEKCGETLTNRPTKISSLLEFERLFGTPVNEQGVVVTVTQTTDGNGNVDHESVSAAFGSGSAPSPNVMHYAMQAYFENGGGDCYIVSVGSYGDASVTPVLSALRAGLDAIRSEDEPTLLVFPEAQGLRSSDHYALISLALEQCADLQDRFVIADTDATGEGLRTAEDLTAAIQAFRKGVSSSSVEYGAAYFPNLDTVFDYALDTADVTVAHTVDGADGALDGADVASLETTQGALYDKMLLALRDMPVRLPPSSSIAGVYVRVDNARGVWKAPANQPVMGVSRAVFPVTDETQDYLHVDSDTGKSVNAIRAFSGRGLLVWGARTLDGNSKEWRYVSVRRFFNFVAASARKATARFVFEPNDANTWVKVRGMIENFLLRQWRAGAMQGGKPEQAFYVRIGLGETMTALDIREGCMVVEIGMAVVRPAEFIVLRFSHKQLEA
jgi:phage tail sheath protein FI